MCENIEIEINDEYIDTIFKEIDNIILQKSKKLKKYEKEYILFELKKILLNLKENNIDSKKYDYTINKIREYIGIIGMNLLLMKQKYYLVH